MATTAGQASCPGVVDQHTMDATVYFSVFFLCVHFVFLIWGGFVVALEFCFFEKEFKVGWIGRGGYL